MLLQLQVGQFDERNVQLSSSVDLVCFAQLKIISGLHLILCNTEASKLDSF